MKLPQIPKIDFAPLKGKILGNVRKFSWPKPKYPEWAKKPVYVEKKVPHKPLLPLASKVVEKRALVTSGDMFCYAILAPDDDVLRIELWIKGHKVGALSPAEAHQLVALISESVGLPYASD